jgi:hypothetical protein
LGSASIGKSEPGGVTGLAASSTPGNEIFRQLVQGVSAFNPFTAGLQINEFLLKYYIDNQIEKHKV